MNEELTARQKEAIFEKGYIKVPGLVSQKRINVALRAINYSIGKGLDPKDVERFRASSFCPELQGTPPIADLLYETGLLKLAESATERGKLKIAGSGQIALRFPVMEYPGDPHPHLDGMYRPNNTVRKGTIFSFTLLAGVFLSDVPNRFWGNFTVWPGTHRSFEKYFKQHGASSLLKGMPKIQMPEPEQILARAGDVILCHYQLAHTVVINVSPYIRYAVFFRLMHQEHEKNRTEVFTNIWLEWMGIRERNN